MICFSLRFWLWCAFYNRLLKKHIILLSKCTSRLADKRIHIKLVSSVMTSIKPKVLERSIGSQTMTKNEIVHTLHFNFLTYLRQHNSGLPQRNNTPSIQNNHQPLNCQLSTSQVLVEPEKPIVPLIYIVLSNILIVLLTEHKW